MPRALKACPICGREMTGNNLARHVAAHETGTARTTAHRSTNAETPPAASTNGDGRSTRAVSLIIGGYLDERAAHSAGRNGGRRRTNGVALGALPNFPNFSSDPDEIDRAADAIERTATTDKSSLAQLRIRQRVRTLRWEAEMLREGAAQSWESEFVEVAAAWADANGIEYDTFREMGVPAGVLRRAGISR
jgi:hypothetical protein